MIKVGTIKIEYPSYKIIFNDLVFPPSNNKTLKYNLNGEEYEVLCIIARYKQFNELSPYEMRDSYGRIMENIWQFSKIYQVTPATNTKQWTYPQTFHVDEKTNTLTVDYYKWRYAGMSHQQYVRYNVPKKYTKYCIGAITDGTELDFNKRNDTNDENFYGMINIDLNGKNSVYSYTEARKKIYVPVYEDIARKTNLFKTLVSKLKSGINLLIVEVDGPRQESLPYYQSKYGVPNDWITNNTIEVNDYNIDIMINDAKHSFGHGYVLGNLLYQTLK